MILLADDIFPTGMSDVLQVPGGATILALIIFFIGWRLEKGGRKAPWKWIALLPIGYGLYVGWFSYLWPWVSDPIYSQEAGRGMAKRMLAAHWGAFLIPLLALATMILFQVFRDRIEIHQD